MKNKSGFLLYLLSIVVGLLILYIRQIHKKKIIKTDETPGQTNDWEGQVDEREEKIINYVQKYGKINTRKCKEIIGASEATANRALANMFHRAILNRSGAGRGVYYFLKNINN